MESQSLERSVLEGKDRESLHEIAVALGGRPGSRARKAQIIDQILELAGVTGAGGGVDAAAAADDAGAADAEASQDAPAAQAQVGSGSGGGAAMAATGGGAAARRAGGDRGARRQGAEQRGDRRGGATRDDAGSRGDGRDDHDGASDQGSGRSQDAVGAAGAQHEGPGAEDDQQATRRRRRRGRGDRAEEAPAPEEETVAVAGVLDLRDEGYGFLRLRGYLQSKEDVYVSVKQVRQFGLRKGDRIEGVSRAASRSEKNPALLRIDSVNGDDPAAATTRPRFEDLTPLFPDERLRLERDDDRGNMTARIIDLLAPIGKGQRGLIVSPPKAGKTMIMKQIARSIEANHPEAELVVVLVDERPEEVTDFRRWLQRGEVVASTFDRPAEEHISVAELVIERAKRRVEQGGDVVLVLDGITRLARAYNLAAPATGRIMSGGIDAGALYPPKRFFGAARNVEEGGSLTILATALVETNSRMDEHIFEEFKGTGNMELRLDRRLAERRIYPAIDVEGSSTRHEELLFSRAQLQMVWKLRRVLTGLAADGSPSAGLEMLIERLSTFPSNDEFLSEIGKAP